MLTFPFFGKMSKSPKWAVFIGVKKDPRALVRGMETTVRKYSRMIMFIVSKSTRMMLRFRPSFPHLYMW